MATGQPLVALGLWLQAASVHGVRLQQAYGDDASSPDQQIRDEQPDIPWRDGVVTYTTDRPQPARPSGRNKMG